MTQSKTPAIAGDQAAVADTAAPRAERLAATFADRDIDALVTFHMPNVRWLTGFTGSRAAAIVHPDARIFVTDFRYLSQSAQQVGSDWAREIAPEPIGGVAAQIAKRGVRRVGFEARYVSVEEHRELTVALPPEAELVPTLDAIEGLRAHKDAAEVETMRRAASIGDGAIQEVVSKGLVGRREREVALEIEFSMRERGATSASFAPIVASGPHAALPHAAPRDVPIERGSLVVVDIGALVDGYRSDCSRTFAAGEPTARAREVYEVVRCAQETALAGVQVGRGAVELDALARDIITAAGHGEHYGHGLSHGLGLELGEIPLINPRSDAVVGLDNVLTVEPGVYIPGELGVRIEDLVHVTSDGPDLLTTLPKELQIVD